MVIIAILLMIVVSAASYIVSFPGGPQGYLICWKVWLKKKGLGRKTKSQDSVCLIR